MEDRDTFMTLILINTMSTDYQATPAVTTSAAMVLTYITWYVPVAASEGLHV